MDDETVSIAGHGCKKCNNIVVGTTTDGVYRIRTSRITPNAESARWRCVFRVALVNLIIFPVIVADRDGRYRRRDSTNTDPRIVHDLR